MNCSSSATERSNRGHQRTGSVSIYPPAGRSPRIRGSRRLFTTCTKTRRDRRRQAARADSQLTDSDDKRHRRRPAGATADGPHSTTAQHQLQTHLTSARLDSATTTQRTNRAAQPGNRQQTRSSAVMQNIKHETYKEKYLHQVSSPPPTATTTRQQRRQQQQGRRQLELGLGQQQQQRQQRSSSASSSAQPASASSSSASSRQ